MYTTCCSHLRPAYQPTITGVALCHKKSWWSMFWGHLVRRLHVLGACCAKFACSEVVLR